MRFNMIWRALLCLAAALSFASCSEPKCPKGWIQEGDLCRRCPRGMARLEGMCVPLPGDGGEAGVDAGEEDNSDAGAAEPESGVEAVDDDGGSTSCLPQAEICGNKRDDDCDGEVDEEESERPEECNGLDDNCDGVIDEGVMTRQSRTDIWPQSIERQNFSQVAMLPREGGGGWLLYRAGDATRVDDTPRNVSIVDIQEDSERAGTTSEAQARTAGTTHFVADGDGRWVVVASRQIPTDLAQPPSQNVRVQLYKAYDLGFVGEYNVSRRSEINYTTFVLPLAVSLLEAEDGTIHILVASAEDDGSGSGWAHLRLQTIKRAVTGQWSTTGSFQLFDDPSALSIAMSRVPCREEWVVATAPSEAANAPGPGQLARYAPGQAHETQVMALQDAVQISGLGRSDAGCESDPEIVLGYTLKDGRTRLRRFVVSRMSGEFRQTDEASMQAKLLGLDFTTWKGRWWLSGANTDGALTLLELRFGVTPPTTSWRILDVDGPNPGDLVQLGDSRSLLAGGLTALLPLRDRLLVAAGNGRGGNLTDLLRARQTTLDQAAAVTYSIGCP